MSWILKASQLQFLISQEQQCYQVKLFLTLILRVLELPLTLEFQFQTLNQNQILNLQMNNWMSVLQKDCWSKKHNLILMLRQQKIVQNKMRNSQIYSEKKIQCKIRCQLLNQKDQKILMGPMTQQHATLKQKRREYMNWLQSFLQNYPQQSERKQQNVQK